MIENAEKEQQPTQQQVVPAKMVLPPLHWPTSKPGPKITPPPVGTKPLPGRTDQVVGNNFTSPTRK